ncbi:MAG TPA: tyrosine-protein phosphatase [Pseudomonadales bacterium]|nr:tyrosine-protein phosphatase [Pseudomonadales bacterium]
MQRHYNLPGLINFRDLGGYPVTDLAGNPRLVKPGRLFRAGHFHDVDDSTQQVLQQLGIDTIFDLRNSKEREKRPSRFAETHAPVIHNLELDPGSGASWKGLLSQSDSTGKITLDTQQVEQVMCTLNTSLVTDHAAVYRQLFEILLAHEPQAAVFHCASGKDRTGIAAALLLAALGASRNTLVADYLLTNEYLDTRHHIARAMADAGTWLATVDSAALQALYEVRAAYINAALDKIDMEYDSIDAYLADAIGVGEKQRHLLQERYLV